MPVSKKLLALAALIVVTSCKVEITVPEGGAVTTEVNAYRVKALETDSIDVNDTSFHETFVAEPADGYLFAGWKKQERGLCGGSLAPCELYTSWMAGYNSLMAILESDEYFYLTPSFLPAEQIRLYAEGDSVNFSGSLSEKNEFKAEVVTKVTARLEILAASDSLVDKNVLAAKLTVVDQKGEELISGTTQYWQEEVGSFYDLTDEFGNEYRDASTNQPGLVSIPAPLVPSSSSELQFYTLSDGPIAAPLTAGTRKIDVGEYETLPVPLAPLEAYPVTVFDSRNYLTAFGEFRQDERVDREELLWVSQVKGVIKMRVVKSRFSRIGKLQSMVTLELEATGANF